MPLYKIPAVNNHCHERGQGEGQTEEDSRPLTARDFDGLLQVFLFALVDLRGAGDHDLCVVRERRTDALHLNLLFWTSAAATTASNGSYHDRAISRESDNPRLPLKG